MIIDFVVLMFIIAGYLKIKTYDEIARIRRLLGVKVG